MEAQPLQHRNVTEYWLCAQREEHRHRFGRNSSSVFRGLRDGLSTVNLRSRGERGASRPVQAKTNHKVFEGLQFQEQQNQFCILFYHQCFIVITFQIHRKVEKIEQSITKDYVNLDSKVAYISSLSFSGHLGSWGVSVYCVNSRHHDHWLLNTHCAS